MSTISTLDKFLVSIPFVGGAIAQIKQKPVKDQLDEEFYSKAIEIDRRSKAVLKSKNINDIDGIEKERQALKCQVAKNTADMKACMVFNSDLFKYGAIGSLVTVAIIVSAVAILAITGLLSTPLIVGAAVLGASYLGFAGFQAISALYYKQEKHQDARA